MIPHRQVRGRTSVGQAAPLGQRDPLPAQRAAQLDDQARLAHAGLPDDADHLAAARARLRYGLLELGEHPLAADEAPEGPRLESSLGGPLRPDPHDAVGADRVSPALHLHRSHLLDPYGAGHQPGGCPVSYTHLTLPTTERV